MARCINCLKELELFRGLEKQEFVNVCLAATKKIIEKGSYLFNQGEPANTLYLVKAGKLKLVQLTEGGREIIVDILGPGEVLGETVLFQRGDYLYSAQAIETPSPTRLLEQSKKLKPTFFSLTVFSVETL